MKRVNAILSASGLVYTRPYAPTKTMLLSGFLPRYCVKPCWQWQFSAGTGF